MKVNSTWPITPSGRTLSRSFTATNRGFQPFYRTLQCPIKNSFNTLEAEKPWMVSDISQVPYGHREKLPMSVLRSFLRTWLFSGTLTELLCNVYDYAMLVTRSPDGGYPIVWIKELQSLVWLGPKKSLRRISSTSQADALTSRGKHPVWTSNVRLRTQPLLP